MEWYYILLIVIGFLLSMYLTGVITYKNTAKGVANINLLTYEEKYLRTDRGIIDVRKTLSSLQALSVLAGIFFPFTWILVITAYFIQFFQWILSPLTRYILNK